MEILEAYCRELGQVLSIYEAREEYFARPEPRKRFNFLCSDEGCRKAASPTVVAANYHKAEEDSDVYVQPYFRAHDKHPHEPSCVWVLSDKARTAADDGEDRERRPSRAKETRVIDAFNPRSADPQLAPGGRPKAPPELPVDDLARPDDKPKVPGAREGVSRTSRLEQFIDCWCTVSPEERREKRVVLDGETATYRQAVLRLEWIVPQEVGRRILWGAAKVSLWPKDKPTRVYLNFYGEGLKKFEPIDGSTELCIDLPLRRIREYRGGGLMMERIERALEPGYYLTVYCWGKIVPREGRPGYTVEIASLHNLVLKPTARKTKLSQAQSP